MNKKHSASISSASKSGLKRSKPAPLTLEARLMFDGAAIATAVADVPSAAEALVTDSVRDTPLAAQPEVDRVMGHSAQNEIVFIDSGVTDWQVLAAGINPNAEFVLLDPARNALDQMLESLKGRSGLDAIHIVSHGTSGGIVLGETTYSERDIAQHQAQMAAIGNSLTASGDILLYGCDVSKGSLGEAFVQAIAQATGADVAASEDITGSAARAGDWDLEYATGRIETSAFADDGHLQQFAGILADAPAGNDKLTIGTDSNGIERLSGTFGERDIPVFGQTFKVPTGGKNVIETFSLHLDPRGVRDIPVPDARFIGYLAEWTGDKAGQILWKSPVTTLSLDAALTTVTFSKMDIELDAAKTYVFFLSTLETTDGVAEKIELGYQLGSQNPYADGKMVFFSTNQFSRVTTNSWDSTVWFERQWGDKMDLEFSATFVAKSAVQTGLNPIALSQGEPAPDPVTTPSSGLPQTANYNPLSPGRTAGNFGGELPPDPAGVGNSTGPGNVFNPEALIAANPTAAGSQSQDVGDGAYFAMAAVDYNGQNDGFMVFVPPGVKMNFELPKSFTDGPAAALVAIQMNGEELPNWLRFDPATGKFVGKAPKDMAGTIRIQITGKDAQGRDQSIRVTLLIDPTLENLKQQSEQNNRAVADTVVVGKIAEKSAPRGRAGFSEQVKLASKGAALGERGVRTVPARAV